MNGRTFLDMTHNPFTPPREGFYTGADRQTHLDHIRHLSQWSRRILLVTGPFGIGKSTLFNELSNNLESNTKAARLSGSVVNTDRDVLLAVGNGFGVALESEMHLDDMIQVLAQHANEQDQQSRTCMAMIDDAQLLDHQAVTALVQLLAESKIRLVMFAEATLIANVSKAAKQQELEWFEIRLTGFPAQDVRDYLEWRFAQAQYRGRLPFTDEQLEKIVARSGGNPNVIDFMANELLADLETGEVRKEAGFPKQHVALAGALLVLVVLIYVLYQDPEPEVAETPVVAVLEPQNDTTIEDAADREVPADGPAAEQVVLEGAEGATEGLDAATPEPETAETSGGASVEANLESNVGSDGETQRGETNVQAMTPITLEEEATEDVAVQVQPAPSPLQSTSTPPRTTTQSRIPVEEASTPVDAPAQNVATGVNGVDWLAAQNPSHFTLQLVTLSKKDNGVALIKRQADADEFALYPLERNGRELHVVTYGVFSSRQAADQAGRGLSGELAGLKPWIRQFGDIQRNF